MAQDLRIELPEMVSFITTRTINSELWMTNNEKLEEMILGYLARIQERHKAIIYGFVLMGNHYHLLAKFPDKNRAAFMRDFNSVVANTINKLAKRKVRDPVWARRYSSQAVPLNSDVEDRFFYLNLNPVHSGLAKKIKDYNSYVSFNDSINDIQKKYKVVDWRKYNDKRRTDKTLNPQDFTTEHTLVFSRLPGYEHLSKSEYVKVMLEKLEEKRQEAIAKRLADGKGFATLEMLKKVRPGSAPKSTKTSTRHSKRPLVLTSCPKAREQFLQMYFAVRDAYTEAYQALKKKVAEVKFPTGTYPPIVMCVC